MSRYIDFYLIGELVDFHGNVHYEDLKNLPTADVVEVKHAIWMPIQRGDEGYSAGDFICSCCGKPNHCYKVTDYCCSCGARMERKR